MKFGRKTDLLSPQEREIVDRFERGVIDAAEAGRLLIASVQRVDDSPASAAEPAGAAEPAPAPEEPAAEEEAVAYPNETAEETAARLLVERIAREVDEELRRWGLDPLAGTNPAGLAQGKSLGGSQLAGLPTAACKTRVHR
jgi:hypothetical protein